MTSDGPGRRLIAALADSTPAFAPAPKPLGNSRGGRLLSALADSTPALRAEGGSDATTSVDADETVGTADRPPQPTTVEVAALAVVADNVALLDPAERIAARAWFPADTLQSVRTVAEFAASAAELVHEFDVDIVRTRDRAGQLADNLARDFSITVTIARGRVLDATFARDHVSDIAGRLADHINRARGLARSLTRADHGVGNLADAHELERTLASALTIALAVADETDLDLEITPATSYTVTVATGGDASSDAATRGPTPAGVPDMDAARGRATDLDRHFARELAGAIGSDRRRARALIVVDEQDRDFAASRALFSAELAAAIGRLLEALTDMTGADLRSADLRGVPLTGVRWSSSTLWPPAREELIRRDSVELSEGAGLYEIRPGGLHADALVPFS
ncbi:hypothetical protein ACWEIJ_31950 [Lentzea sp. NPDC004789]